MLSKNVETQINEYYAQILDEYGTFYIEIHTIFVKRKDATSNVNKMSSTKQLTLLIGLGIIGKHINNQQKIVFGSVQLFRK